MQKKVEYTTQGFRADVGETKVYRILPNRYTHHVGHFVFLDYVPPVIKKSRMIPDVGGAHPHRGIATLTYVLNGEAEHYDSRGHRATVYSGGVQWMKAGNGIIHDETMNADMKTDNPYIHGFQFWINLPVQKKREDPDYMAVQAGELPLLQLKDNSGSLKVVVGGYNGQTSKIPTYAKQDLYHIHLNAGNPFTFPVENDLEYAVFLLKGGITVNGVEYKPGEFIGFDTGAGVIEIANNSASEAAFILFGGEKYTEPFVAKGPFVMSTQEEIDEAYSDYRKGKYGEVVYS